ncbi:Transcription factor [Friedmanniomyces endolithicus]|nr:Transcription factor [Friedmanniomyces endolithicus]
MNNPSLPTHARHHSGDLQDSKNGTSHHTRHGDEHEEPHSPPSPKRKFSEGIDSAKKAKRSKVQNACIYCRRSHMTCDQQRPCARCVKRDIGHLCHDEPREHPKQGKSESGVQDIAPAPEDGKAAVQVGELRRSLGGVEVVDGSEIQQRYAGAQLGGLDGSMDMGMSAGEPRQLVQPTPISPTQIQRHTTLDNNPNADSTTSNTTMAPQTFDWSNTGLQNQFQDMHHLHPNYMFNTSEVTNEYNLLNDFLSSSLIDDGAYYSNPDDLTQTLFSDPILPTSSLNAPSNTTSVGPPQQQPPAPPLPSPAPPGPEISRPPSAFPPTHPDTKARETFYLTAADPAGLDSAGNRLHKLLKAKYDAGMLKPFNYVKGYARLQTHMSRHLHPSSQRRILEQLSRFRPKFREAMQGLSDVQLVLVEMWFERSLMEYDRVFASMAIPACCWRRTGEIFRGNREMADLLRVPMERLRDGRLAIHEIVAEESLVSYWEKFGAIAFDWSQKAILTSCTLMVPPPAEAQVEVGGVGKEGKREAASANGGAEREKEKVGERVRCCFSFTIRRDMHNIPSLIVGNFLPIRPRPQQPSSQS